MSNHVINIPVNLKQKTEFCYEESGGGGGGCRWRLLGSQTISYTIKFIDSARFVANSLSSLVDNLAERIHRIKFKNCDCFLEYEGVKENLIKYKWLSCNKEYSNKFDEKLKKRFKNTFNISNNDINKFILLLKKGIYPYKYLDDWESFN